MSMTEATGVLTGMDYYTSAWFVVSTLVAIILIVGIATKKFYRESNDKYWGGR